jgi:hypothetical protein
MASLTTVQSMNSFASSLNLEFGLGASLTGTATGNALISGGVLDMTGAGFKKVYYAETYGNLPLGQKFAFLCRYKPNYSNTPATRQNIFNTTQLLGVGNNQCYFYHSSATGHLELYITNHVGTQIVYETALFQPVAGTWYELMFYYDFTLGAVGFYVNDSRVAAASGYSYTRLPLNSYWQIGGDASDNSSHEANFSMKDVILYNAPPTMENERDIGYTMPTLSTATQAVPNVNQVESGVQYNYGSMTGTLVATADYPTISNVKTGITYGNGTLTGTYTGSDRWSDPGVANVVQGVEYKANSTTNNRTGTYVLEVESESVPENDFPSIESVVVDQTINLLGREVDYTCDGYSAVTIKGVFNNAFVEVEGVVTLRPILRINISDLPASPGKNDTIEINSVEYRVLESQRDGYGGTTLVLQKV